MKNESVISIHGSHNGGIAAYHDGSLYIVEAEKFFGMKNSGFCQYKIPHQDKIAFSFQSCLEFLQRKYNLPSRFNTCLHQSADYVIGNDRLDLLDLVDHDKAILCNHHESHANGSFYQSDFLEALVISYDGGGNDGQFNIYLADRKKGVNLIRNYFMVNLGFPYMVFGHFFSDISQETLSEGNLVYSGKIMGLEAFGQVIERWLPFFEDFYDCPMHANLLNQEDDFFYKKKLDKLTENTNIIFHEEQRLGGQIEYDVAATSQRAFENVFLKYTRPYIEKYPDLPIILTGGCALNISLNTRIKDEFKRPMFIAPNSSDCGLPLGMLLGYLRPDKRFDATYAGLPLLDKDSYLSIMGLNLLSHGNESAVSDVNLSDLAAKLKEGDIIGVSRGKAEHGPRALGNRSILCNPSVEGMKEKLNDNVKHREWFRPFAPVVRLEDVNKYFVFEGESRFMSYACKVKKKWKKRLASITHIDGTARVQTVTRDQNPWLYDLLTHFNKINDHGVLLNTSLNVNGKPIVSTIQESILMLEHGLDSVVIEDRIISKNDI